MKIEINSFIPSSILNKTLIIRKIYKDVYIHTNCIFKQLYQVHTSKHAFVQLCSSQTLAAHRKRMSHFAIFFLFILSNPIL